MEDHHDDCGEDFGPLGDDYFAEEDPDDGMEPLVSDSEHEVCCMHLTEVGMKGSDFIPETQEDSSAIGAVNFEDLESFIAWNSSQTLGFHDVAELCGGAGDTGILLVRRGYRGEPNFDIACGIDLLKPCNNSGTSMSAGLPYSS